MTNLRSFATDLFTAAVARADPEAALETALQQYPPNLPTNKGHLILVALGKAAIPMLRRAMQILPRAEAALAVTNPENRAELDGAQVMSGAHPVPDHTSVNAGLALRKAVTGLDSSDRVIALISGGGSSLAAVPAPGLTLADKTTVTKQLLASGMGITEMNLIRQQLSDVKGGGLLRQAHPALVSSYILSDVIGDDLRAIASGPTVAPLGTRTEARDLLQQHGIWSQLPTTVKTHLSIDVPPTVPPAGNAHLIGSNRHSLDAMRVCATAAGWLAQIVDDALIGDVEAAAQRIIHASQETNCSQPQALIFGGETTVQLSGTGLGGRNQELALHVARMGRKMLQGRWVFLSGGTDGRDGPTAAAGGIVDAGTWGRIETAGGDPDALLADNDSNRALAMANDLLLTGGTGTNVADVQILLQMPK
ncbi:glycerate kinase type-2 family protein [Phaeobacter porticola]|uniref:Putative hydroxypyruvate reductase n=1 Tax=Phaeobacter porticola TaxID=1844006 RepID=A0A1L3I0G6_9RHOB|nr:DUF4147 domain-containing protein [Phaeobacter porticola]APG45601.1 putative hydroxypyruvate reductase [Phaeobacter porticola]